MGTRLTRIECRLLFQSLPLEMRRHPGPGSGGLNTIHVSMIFAERLLMLVDEALGGKIQFGIHSGSGKLSFDQKPAGILSRQVLGEIIRYRSGLQMARQLGLLRLVH